MVNDRLSGGSRQSQFPPGEEPMQYDFNHYLERRGSIHELLGRNGEDGKEEDDGE